MTENWVIVIIADAWMVVQLARILASYRTTKRKAELGAGRAAS